MSQCSIRCSQKSKCLQDHVLQRAFTVEPIQAMVATADGMYVAGGGASGTIYIWAAGSGQLLRSWPAHYKVSCLCIFRDFGHSFTQARLIFLRRILCPSSFQWVNPSSFSAQIFFVQVSQSTTLEVIRGCCDPQVQHPLPAGT